MPQLFHFIEPESQSGVAVPAPPSLPNVPADSTNEPHREESEALVSHFLSVSIICTTYYETSYDCMQK